MFKVSEQSWVACFKLKENQFVPVNVDWQSEPSILNMGILRPKHVVIGLLLV